MARLSLRASAGGFGAEEFAAEDGAEDEIVEIAGEAVDAEESADLRPVAGFVEQDVRDDFSGRGAENASKKIEVSEDVPFVRRKRFDEMLEVVAALAAEFEEGFGAVGGHADGIGERAAGEAVDVAFFGGENVLDDVADGGEAVAVGAGAGFKSGVAALDEPFVEFAAFPVGVVHEIGEAEINGHDAPPRFCD